MSLTREQKILIAAGLLVAVLYIGAVANGRGSGEGDAGSPAGGVVGVLAGWLGSAADADRADLGADCFDPSGAATAGQSGSSGAATAGQSSSAGQLAVKGSCTLRVAPSERDLRVVRLRADRPVSVTARLPGSERTGTAEVAAGDEASVAVDGDGGDIVIACTCVVTVLNGG